MRIFYVVYVAFVALMLWGLWSIPDTFITSEFRIFLTTMTGLVVGWMGYVTIRECP